MAKKAPQPLDAAYAMSIHAAVAKVVEKRGYPDFVTYDDMYNYIIGELKDMTTLSEEEFVSFFADFLLEIEQKLEMKFYGTRLNATLRRRPNARPHAEAGLELTSVQQKLYDQYERLIKRTVNSAVALNHLDPMIDRDDLEQAGRIALARAVRAYEDGRNFDAYVIQHIRRAVMSTIGSSTQKRANITSLDVMLDENDQTESVAQLHDFVGEDVADSFERTELINVLLAEAERYPVTHCIHKGILACIEVHVHGRTWTELGDELGVTPCLVSAWAKKAYPVLRKSRAVCEMLGKDRYRTAN